MKTNKDIFRQTKIITLLPTDLHKRSITSTFSSKRKIIIEAQKCRKE